MMRMTSFYRRKNRVYAWVNCGIGTPAALNYVEFDTVEKAKEFIKACKNSDYVEFGDFHDKKVG